MSDKPEGPGWWVASDGKWYPPELHPAVRNDLPEPAAVPGQPGTGGGPVAVPEYPGATGETATDQPRRRQGGAQAGPQFPDLFKKALQGNHLADNVTVRYDDGDHRASADPTPTVHYPLSSEHQESLAGATAGGPGEFTGASVHKRRWRRH